MSKRGENGIMKDSDWKILTILSQTQNITRTAELLFLTQPTLTKRLKQIEEELGTQLIIRGTKGITLTPKGITAAAYGQKILELIDEMKLQLTESRQWDEGTLRIGISGSIANYVMPGFFADFSQKHPKLRTEITDYISEDTIQLVQGKKLDFGFICTEVYSSNIAKYLLRTEPCYVVSKNPVSLEDLPSLPRIFVKQNTYSNELAQNWWNERYSAPPLFGFKAGNGEIAVQMIQRGLCYGLIYYRGKDYFKEHGLYAKPLYYLDGTPLARNCFLIYHRSREQDSLIQNFMNEIKNYDFSVL